MKTDRILSVLMFCMAATPAMAGVDLAWNDCALAPSAAVGTTLDCQDPAAIHRLFATFRPELDIPDFVALEFVIDFGFEVEMPPFWHFEGGCNEGLGVSIIPLAGTCSGLSSPFAGRPAEYHLYEPHMPGPNRSRLIGGMAMPSGAIQSLTTANRYRAFRVDFGMEAAQTLAGCETPGMAAITLRLFGESGSTQELTWSSEWSPCVGINRPYCFFVEPDESANPGTAHPSPCGPTPVASRTWGTIKSLYR